MNTNRNSANPLQLPSKSLVTLMTEAASTSEMLVNFNQITWFNNLEGSHLKRGYGHKLELIHSE